MKKNHLVSLVLLSLTGSLALAADAVTPPPCSVNVFVRLQSPQLGFDTGIVSISQSLLNSDTIPFNSLSLRAPFANKGYSIQTTGKGEYSASIDVSCGKFSNSHFECSAGLLLVRNDGSENPPVINRHNLDQYHTRQTSSSDLDRATFNAINTVTSWMLNCSNQ